MDLQKKRVTVIDYIDGHHFDADGSMLPTIKSEVIVMNSVKRYYNCIYLLAGLRPAARNLMDFLTEEMTADNIVYNNQHVRDKFVTFMKIITSKINELEVISYTDQTVKDSYSQLAQRGLLIPISKGTYKVNPKYFFVGDDKLRVKEIKVELEIKSDGTNFRVIRITEK